MTTLEHYIKVVEDYQSEKIKNELPSTVDLRFCLTVANILLEEERFNLDRKFDEGWNQCLNNQNK